MACDSQATMGNWICNNDFEKVYRFDSEEFGSVFVAFAGSVNHIVEAVNFLECFFAGETPDQIKFDGQQMQILMLTEDSELFEGTLTEASTGISWVPCETPYAIGSGSYMAIGAMSAGATAEEAVKIVAKLDCYTNDNVKVYNAEDLSYKHILNAKKDILQKELERINGELDDFEIVDEELEGTVESSEGCVGCEECTCKETERDSDWIEWKGEDDPYWNSDGYPVNLASSDIVEVRFRDKERELTGDGAMIGKVYEWIWTHDYPFDEYATDIIAYRVISED